MCYRTETEYVSQMLTIIKRFAQHHSCHVWFVAHPRQLHHWDGGPPNMYDLSGSAHFINKCDNGIVIHRNRNPDAGPVDQVQVCVRKVRNKVIGTTGDAFLSYDRYGVSFSHYCIVFNQVQGRTLLWHIRGYIICIRF
ncbi:Twinkle-like protein, chloroplastic/mitochondrial [Vitis vinifera]|uniref:Twinkle-like protein, chloroplastic/mitochondrial n=1 Tax=Vitis vinifera TaxID=29760 RepID=A0A438K494_VITVI|nr:Twinkle-like protein, chloroplastic/mitochondrial [Vitis vinifera]